MPKDTQRTATDQALDHLPEPVTVAVAELASAAGQGLLALAVGTGLQVLQAMLAEGAAGPVKRRWTSGWTRRATSRHPGGAEGRSGCPVVSRSGRRPRARQPAHGAAGRGGILAETTACRTR